MTDRHETGADIAAEIRAKCRSVDGINCGIADFLALADRIEAAAKRETATNCSGLGNADKLREALEKALMAFYNITGECLSECDAALAAPPRNCDVGTPEEQHERFAAFCKEVDECAYCAIPGLTSSECALLWAGLPFGTKNNERSRQTCANCGTNHDFCETENCKRYGVCGNWTAAQEGGDHADA